MNVLLHVLCYLIEGEEKRDRKCTPDEDDLTFVQTDSRKRRLVKKQTQQRQVADVEPDNVADRLRKPTFMPRILASTPFVQLHRLNNVATTKTTECTLPKTPSIERGKEFAQQSNMTRHLGRIHGQNEDGTAATSDTLAKLRNRKRKSAESTEAPASKAPKSCEFLSDTSSSLSFCPHPEHVFK